jgi:hypothetical protein
MHLPNPKGLALIGPSRAACLIRLGPMKRRVNNGAGAYRSAKFQWIGWLNRKIRKKRWRHLHCEFLKQPHRTRYVTVAQMHERQVECGQVPFGPIEFSGRGGGDRGLAAKSVSYQVVGDRRSPGKAQKAGRPQKTVPIEFKRNLSFGSGSYSSGSSPSRRASCAIQEGVGFGCAPWKGGAFQWV